MHQPIHGYCISVPCMISASFGFHNRPTIIHLGSIPGDTLGYLDQKLSAYLSESRFKTFKWQLCQIILQWYHPQTILLSYSRVIGLQRSFSCNLGDHHLTTVQRDKNRLVRKCHRLLLHVRVLFPKFCSFRRPGRVLARSIKIVGAWLSNQPI